MGNPRNPNRRSEKQRKPPAPSTSPPARAISPADSFPSPRGSGSESDLSLSSKENMDLDEGGKVVFEEEITDVVQQV